MRTRPLTRRASVTGFMAVVCAGLAGCSLWQPTPSLLRGLPPVQQSGTQFAERLTDGIAGSDGSGWNGPTVALMSPGASVVFDLGTERPIAGAALQGDNNDTYELSGSADGVTFNVIWLAPTHANPGLQTRIAAELHATARYLKLRPVSGDNAFSVSELEVYGETPRRPFADVKTPSGESADSPVDTAWSQWAVMCALALALTTRKSPQFMMLVGLAVVIGGAYHAWSVTNEAWLTRAQPVSWVRAMAGLVMGLVALRELIGLGRRAWAPHRGLIFATALTSAVVGAACFFNLGHAQFFDAGRGQPTFLHHYDMRHYFPIARYFKELRFDGVYAASAQALIELDHQADPGPLSTYTLRNLRTHEMSTIGAMRDHIAEVRGRFTDARWAEFLADARYFRNAMGANGYLSSMNDHGGNATPVWFLSAMLLFRWGPASDSILWAGVMLDMLLVALSLWAAARAFGWRTALVCACVFGAMDFYMFGTNWFGATFRHDWLALWALGVSALKLKRYRLAGALLVWSAMIRAFPALAFVVLFGPEVLEVAITLFKTRTLPSLKAWAQAHQPLVDVVVGAALWGGVLFVASTLAFGFDAWAEWLRKVSLLNRDAHVNNIALRTWFVQDPTQLKIISLVAVGVVTVLARRFSLPQRAAIAVVLLPIVFNPANYYLHSMFMLPMVADETPGQLLKRWPRLTFIAICAMCVASWQTTLTDDIAVHFKAATVLCFITLGIILAVTTAQTWRPRHRRAT